MGETKDPPAELLITKEMIADVMRRSGDHPNGQPIFLLGWLSRRVSPDGEDWLLRAMARIAESSIE